MEDVVITRETILNLQVCSVLSPEETERWVQKHSPAGTSGNWQLSTRGEITQGVTCEQYPERKHYLLDC